MLEKSCLPPKKKNYYIDSASTTDNSPHSKDCALSTTPGEFCRQIKMHALPICRCPWSTSLLTHRISLTTLHSRQVVEAHRERHNGSPSTLEFFDSTLFLFHCYMHDNQYHFLFDLNSTAERCLCRLHFHVCQRHDRGWIEYGMNCISWRYRPETNNPMLRWICQL